MAGWASGEGDVKGVGVIEDVFSVGANLRPKLMPINSAATTARDAMSRYVFLCMP